jgi:hypothetical protein
VKPVKGLACTAFCFWMGCSAASAGTLTFTWDPTGASPSLGGAAFTADSMTLTNYLYAVAQTNGLTPEHFIQPITSFQRNGSTIAAPGLGSAYGLYFDILGVFSSVGGPHFDSLNVRLMADRNADDGTVSSTLAGIGFSNPGGVANDFLLASGTLISATLALDPVTGIRRAHFLDTLVPAPAETGFFVAPVGVPLELDINLTTLPEHFQAIPQPDGSTIQLVNNGAGIAQLVPEPGSMALLAGSIGLFGIARGWRKGRPGRRP